MAASSTTTNPVPPAAQRKRPFYGWAVVAAVFVIMAVTSGLGFYNASVILSAAVDELDASVGSVSGATGLFFAISGVVSFALAKLMDTVDLRWFFAAGGLAGAIALFGLRWVDSIPELYLFFAVFGIGFGTAGLVPSITLVTRWFDRRRSVAISIASSGLSVGGIILTPIAVFLVHRDGLADAGNLLAVMWLVGIIPIALLVIRPFPAALGLRPDGDPSPESLAVTDTDIDAADLKTATTTTDPGANATNETSVDATPPGVPFAQARLSRFFLGVCAAYVFIFFGQVGAMAQIFNMVQERSDAAIAGTALSALAFSSVTARLIGGVVVIRVDTRIFTMALTLLQVAALGLLAVADTPITLVGFAIIFGVAIGNLLMLQPLLLAEAFGVAQYSRIYSSSQLIGTIGVATGPFALGLARDIADYRVAFIVAAVATLFGTVALGASGSTDAVKDLWV